MHQGHDIATRALLRPALCCGRPDPPTPWSLCTPTTQRKKADALHKPDLPAGSDPAEVIVQQCVVIKALQDDCAKLRQLSEKQRLHILRKRPSQQDSCRSCRGSDVQVTGLPRGLHAGGAASWPCEKASACGPPMGQAAL